MATSFDTIKMLIECQAQVPDKLFRTLLVIANYLPKSFPSKTTISKITGKSIRSIQRDIATLELLQLILVERRQGKSSVFRIRDLAKYPIQTRDTAVSPLEIGTQDIAMSPHLGHLGVSPPETQLCLPNKQRSNKLKNKDLDFVDEDNRELQNLIKLRFAKLKAMD